MFPAIRRAMRSLSIQVVAAFVGVIIATAFISGIPAYRLIRLELEQQAWMHVLDGAQTTRALFDAEKNRLSDMAALTAQRPTLQRLLREEDSTELNEYLLVFQTDTGLDILVIRDSSGNVLSGSQWSPLPYSQDASFYMLSDPEPALALIASQSIYDPQTSELLGHVTVGAFLNDAFLRQLEDQTGLGQSIIMGGQRVATSLPDTPAMIDPLMVEQAAALTKGEVCVAEQKDACYYVVLQSLTDSRGRDVAQVEAALPVNKLLVTERRALDTLILAALLIAVICSTLGGLYARRLTSPLRQLTFAARNISRGDFITPVPVPREPDEIATLAHALEESRVNTYRALDDLSQARAWLDTLIQSVIEGIVTVDQQGKITSFSQGASRITGWARKAALGQPLDDILKPVEQDKPLRNLIPSNGTMRQISVMTAQGRTATLAVTGAKLKPPNGGTRQTVLVFRDMTEEEAAQRLRAYFLANISHEFRTPLSALNASVELLIDEIEDFSVAERWELLNSIHRSGKGLQTLIDNLLESSKIEAGRFSIRCRPTDLNDIIADATQTINPLLERRQQTLSVTEPMGLQDVDVDPTRMAQVLVNLLSNASKYSPVGGPIDLIVEWADDHLLRISVADRGPGISPADQASLFRRFVRLDAQDGTQYGVGLGLSVVKAIVEEHGGAVGVDARQEGGSIFWFTLPLKGD
nr:PAS domain S-box protein [Anaerolineae bacterium]